MRRLSLLFAALMLLSVSCTENISEPTNTGGISGFVVDKTTGDPVQTVNVKLKETGASTVTGSDGSFTFKDLENGEYTVLLSKEGYNDNSNTIQVTNGRIVESHFTIERIPAVLTIDREVLDFGDNYSNTTLSFSMVNKNYVDLDWEIVYSCRWIKEVDPMKSIVKLGFGKTQTVVVIIDRDALLAGDNETVLVVRTSDGASELKIKALGQARRLPALNVEPADGISATTAVLNAKIEDKGIPEYTERGFVIGDVDMPTHDSALKVIPATVNTEDHFSARSTELILGKKYYVRAYARNEIGMAYSTNQESFVTTSTLPTVNTLSAISEDRETKTVVLRGNIVYEGEPAYTERGFVWSTVYDVPTIEENKIVISGSGAGDYEKRVTFDAIDKTIYVRAYATNLRGTAYGETIQVFQRDYIIVNNIKLGVQREDITSGGPAYWYDANSMCNNSRVGGLTDWRLPTKDELFQLYNMRNDIGGFTTEPGYNHRHLYWSSTHNPNSGNGNYSKHWLINFSSGAASIEYDDIYAVSARCVRTIE